MERMRRKRRATADLKTIMEPYKNLFFDWAYAGEKETMHELFPEAIPYWEHQSEEIGEDYFDKISVQSFETSDTIKKYGENLRGWRESKGWTLKEVAARLRIDFQQLQQIEMGDRKKINRNLLLIFCAIYLKAPETLMGIDKEPENKVMIFYPEDISQKASYIVDQLMIHNIDLLDAFYYFANKSVSMRRQLSGYLQNIPTVEILSSRRMKNIVERKRELVIENRSWERFWSLYYGGICDAGMETPELLDVYVSITAADQEVQKKVLQLISAADFFPFSPAFGAD